MSVLIENIKFLRNEVLEISQSKLADVLNRGLPKDRQFTRPMVANYEKDITTPDKLFCSRLADLVGVTVKDLTTKRLTKKDVKVDEDALEDPIEINDAGSLLLQNQKVIIAMQRTLLKVLAEVHANQSGKMVVDLLGSYDSILKSELRAVNEDMLQTALSA